MATQTALAPRTRPRPAGTLVERYGWVLVGLLGLMMVIVGLQAFFGHDPIDAAISGSKCCNGDNFARAPRWTYDYNHETSQYMGTFMIFSGVMGLTVILIGLRRAARWAWFACLLFPAIFAVHAFYLNAFPFDLVTMLVTAAGLILMVRPVFGAPRNETIAM